jgi:hypothetical protein
MISSLMGVIAPPPDNLARRCGDRSRLFEVATTDILD